MPPNQTVRLEIPAQHRYLSLIAVCIAELLNQFENLPDRDVQVYNVQLAAQEAAANVVDHAYRGMGGILAVELTLQEDPAQVVVELFDQGVAFDPSTVPTPNLEDFQVRGYGLFLIHSLMDDVSYHSVSGQNCWRMLKRLA